MAAGDAGRILIIEADASLAMVLTDLLASECYAAGAVDGAAPALRVTGAGAVDLVILDLDAVQRGDGWGDTLRSIRNHFAGLPMLLLSNGDEYEEGLRGDGLAPCDCLTTPFHPRELLAKVDALMKSNSKAGLGTRCRPHLTMATRDGRNQFRQDEFRQLEV